MEPPPYGKVVGTVESPYCCEVSGKVVHPYSKLAGIVGPPNYGEVAGTVEPSLRQGGWDSGVP